MKKSVAKGCLSILLSLALVIGMIPSFDVKADPAEGGNGEQPKVYYGDVDDDGEIGPKDVTMLRRFLAGGWNVSINEEKADVDGDGEVGPKDVTVLRRYLAGGWGIKLPDAPDDVLEYPVAIDAQHFPDEAFRNHILSDLDYNNDGYLSKEEAYSATGMYLGGSTKDVTGIEYFGNIETLECLWQGLEKLDVSRNTKLKKINVTGNKLTSLDISKNTALTELYCYSNLLTELDVSNNTALTRLNCGGNQIEELNLSANSDLVDLYCWRNKLKNLNLSNNKELQDLSCGENLIEGLDISQNTKLMYLYCWENKLSELSLKTNTLLEVVECEDNQLSELVLDANTKLIFLDCSKNNLTRLDLSSNTRLTDLKHDQNVEVIRCVEISKDVFPDDIFRSYVSEFDTDNNGSFSVAELEAVKDIDVSGTNVVTLTGIEAFGHLDSLNCSNTKIKYLYFGYEDETFLTIGSIDASNNQEMINLSCWEMGVESLKVSGEKINYIECEGNRITELDLSGCPALERLYCSDNNIQILDLSNNTKIKEGYVSYDPTTQVIWEKELPIEVSYPVQINGPAFPDEMFMSYVSQYFDADKDGFLSQMEAEAVTWLPLSYSGIENLRGIEYFSKLETLECSWLGLETLNVSKNEKLKKIDCAGNQLTSLDVSHNLSLTELYCHGNRLNSLDVSKNHNLLVINCGNNQIENLELSKNDKLRVLYCWRNKLEGLNLSSLVDLEDLDCTENSLTELNLETNTKLSCLCCYDNAIAELDLSYNTKLVKLLCDKDVAVIRNVEINKETFPDDLFRAYIGAVDVDDNGMLSSSEIEAVKDIDVSGTDIISLTGIEVFRHLDSLNCSNTKIERLNLVEEEETYLTINSIDARNNQELTIVDCGYMDISSLKVSGEKVTAISCSGNKLEELDLSGCPALGRLTCSHNKLTALDLTAAPNLYSVYCYGNQLTEIDLSNNAFIESDNVYFEPDVTVIWPAVLVLSQEPLPYHYGENAAFRYLFDEYNNSKYKVEYNYDDYDRVIGFTATAVDSNIKLEASYEYNGGINTKTIWKYSDGTQYVWEYNDSDQLVSKTEKDGVPYRVDYSSSEVKYDTYPIYNTWSAWDYDAPMTEFDYAYDSDGRMASITCSKLGTEETIIVSFEYSETVNVKTTWTYISGKSITWTFDESGNCIQRIETANDGIESYTYDGNGRIIKKINYDQLIYLMPIGSTWSSHAWEWSYVLSEKKYEYTDNGKIAKITCKRLDDGRSVTATYTYENGYHIGTEWLYSDGSSRNWEVYNDEDGTPLEYKYSDSYGNSEINQAYMYTDEDGSWRSFRRTSVIISDIDHYNDGYFTIPCSVGSFVISTSLNFTGYNIEYEYSNDSYGTTRISISDTGSNAVFIAEYEYEDNKLLRYVYNYPDGRKETKELYEDETTKYFEYVSTDGSISWSRYDAQGKLISSGGYTNIPAYAYISEYGWNYDYDMSMDNVESTYTYDEEGKLVKMVCVDAETSETTVIEYEYSDNFNTKRTITYPSGQAETFENIKIDANTFPDLIFRTYVLQNIDNGNVVFTKKEVENIYNFTLIDMGIESLKGIEYFTKLQTLRCCSNAISELDLSKNTMLYDLDCSSNNLSALDISKNTELSYLTCSVNNLGALDISNNTKLMYLYCKDNNITSIDITNNPYLSAANVVCDEGVEIIS